MAKKRVHEIAKERGITSKEALEVLRKAGLDVKVAASSVEEEEAARAFGNGAGAQAPAPEAAAPAADAPAAAETPAAETPAAEAPKPAKGQDGRGKAAARGPRADGPPQPRPDIRPPAGEPVRRAGPEGRGPRILQDAPPPQERQPAPKPGQGSKSGRPEGGARGADGAQGDGPGGRGARPARGGRSEAGAGAAAGGAGGRRRRVVIDSQAARRDRTPPPQQSQPPRRGRGRRRRPQWVEPDLEAEALAKLEAEQAEDPAVQVRSGSTVKEVAEFLQLGAPEVIKKLMELGEMATLTQTLSDEAIEVLGEALGKRVEMVSATEDAEADPVYEDTDEQLIDRPPVITIMGHVDHGKTSLLDAIRETEVAAGEAGGITQHIGAYQVRHDNHTITFLDTPGHEAFTAMRARGAKVTDIAVIVVAADDGVMPQTVEAIDHAKAAGVPVMVAVNKIDKEGSDPNRVRGELAQQGLTPADWGGDTEFVDVSAKTRQNLDDLLETLVTLAEIQELKANPDTDASGFVIESKLDPGRGAVVTLLVHRGRMEVGDAIVAGAHWGRVKAMNDYRGQRVKEATPGMPVEILGFDGVPAAGEHFRVVDNEREARRVANERAIRLKQEALARQSTRRVSLEDVLARAERGDKELNLIVKADVAGSLEALADEIARLPHEQVTVNIIRDGVGGISESDVMLAAASDAVVIGFNVRPVGNAAQVAEQEGVEIRSYSVIYKIFEELRAAMEGLLEALEVEEQVGTVEVRATFKASRVGTIAGSYVTDGVVRRGALCRLVRDGTVVYDGRIGSLRRFKDDVREVTVGMECGIVLENYPDVKEGDVIEAYEKRQVEQTLS
ncbi:MAG: translation initiation factor [Thermoleophilaceae bacterium]|jgi:translation initiation factor IF-2|nr:translation initiation factor [Thermoleophilaceae bacterium]